jgi:hypothetical protein
MAHALTAALQGQLGALREEAQALLAERHEVLP